MSKVYVLGDMLKKGSILLREYEAKVFRALDLPIYTAIEQKDINDKTGVTEEQNNKLAERIVKKDTDAIRKSTIILAEVDNNNVGSCVEIGQIKEMNWYNDKIRDIIMKHTDLMGNGQTDGTAVVKELMHLIDVEVPKKEIYFHTTDIRHTQLNEKGYRRSFSFNQYLVGVCLALNSDGIRTYREVIQQIINKHIDSPNKKSILNILNTDAILGQLEIDYINRMVNNYENRR